MNRKVLIADDEVLVRIGIKHSVEWEKNGLEVIGEASDGKQCLKMVEKWNPDLLILDINMPEMNGIEVLKSLKQKEYDGKIIILTCYEEIEYARQAMKYGASDYVLKTSITENGLLNAIQELKFEERIKRGLESVNDAETELIHIMEGYSEHYERLPLSSNYLYCISVCIMNMEEIMEKYAEKGTGLFYHSLYSIMKQVLDRVKEHVMVNYRSDEIVIFLSFSENPGEQECILQIRQLTKQLQNVLREYLQIEADISISSVKYKLACMREAYEEAKQAHSQKFINPQKNIFYYDGQLNRKEDAESLKEYEMKIRELLSDHHYDLLQEELACYLERVREKGTGDIPSFIRFLCDIGKIIQSNEKMWDDNYEARLSEQNNLEDMEAVLYFMLNLLCDSKDPADNNYLIRKADEYIKEHYKQNISLHTLADYLELSESYTSRLFNRHKGINLPTYVSEYRIAKAKELLKSTNKKIYEIADEVGFSSTTALHIAFKKKEGTSPVDYRNNTNSKK